MSAAYDLQHAEMPSPASAALPRLLRGEIVEGATALKAGTVFRIGDVVLKLYPRSKSLLERLRRPAAVRAVRAYFRLQPTPSPEPLHWDTLDDPNYSSFLVYRYVEGDTLLDAWRSGDAEPREALPQLFADLHAQGVLHADLHGFNLIWTPKGWVVLDLDGVRHSLHAVRRRAITEKIWARLLRDLENPEAGEALYRKFLSLADVRWDADASWARIVARNAK